MSEQTGAPDSRASIEDRLSNALFGPDSPGDDTPEIQASEEEFGTPDVPEGDEQPEAAAPVEDSEPVEEVEFNGKKYKLPPELKEAVLRRDDYTRKTQEVAERARLIEAHEQSMQMRQAFEEATAARQEQMRDLQSQLAQFKQLDWSQLDTDTIVRAKTRQDEVKDRIEELKQGLNGEWQKFYHSVEQQRREVIQQGQKYLQTTIPGWNAQRAQAVSKQAIAEGFTEHQLAAIDRMDNPVAPLLVKLLDKAARYDEIQSKTANALDRAKAAPPVVKPGSADPLLSKRMQALNFRRQVKSAKTTADKNRLILSRLESKFG